MAQVRSQFTYFFGTTLLPMMDEKIRDGYTEKPKKYERIFDVGTMTGSIKSRAGVSGLGLAAEITAEGEEIRTDTFVQGFKKQYVPHKFGLGIEVTREMIDDGDNFDVIASASEELGRSVRETCEIDAASTLNNAFSSSFLGPDGVCLCSASHPMVKYGGNQSNILSVAADLDVTSLELALTDWRGLRRSNGHLQAMPKPRIVVASANEWNINEILRGMMRSDTANNTPNAFRFAEGGPLDDVIIWDYLTDPDAWFLIAPPGRSGLKWFWRRKPDPIQDVDARTERAFRGIVYRKDHGWEDYLGVYGTAGA